MPAYEIYDISWKMVVLMLVLYNRGVKASAEFCSFFSLIFSFIYI